MESPGRQRVVTTVILLLIGYALGVLSMWTSERANTPTTLQQAIERLSPRPQGTEFSQLVTVWERLHSDYVNKEIDDTKLLEGALTGMVAGLGDPYSAYLTSDDAKKFEDEIAGTFEGVGMQVGYKEKKVTVIAPLPKSPAERAGLEAGDTILSVDGKDAGSLTLDEVIDLIRGPQGTTVSIVVQRGAEAQTRTFRVTREKITVDSVTVKVTEHRGKRLADVTISSFNLETARDLRSKLNAINASQLDGVILDLRNNPGGYLNQAVDVASIFVARGLIVAEVDRDGERKSFNALGNAFLDHLKVAVLVNGGSASASEIVAGALQDSGVGTVIGTQTFGKGSVQDYRSLDDGSSLKLTIAHWLTPKGRSIAEQGITPDLIVEAPEEEEATADPQRDRALDWLVPGP